LNKVALISALDTRGKQAETIKLRLEEKDCEVLVVDTGVLGSPEMEADVTRQRVADAGGKSIADLVRAAEEGVHQAGAVKVMSKGVEKLVPELYKQEKFNAIMAAGGSTGTSIALAAMKALPVGVPKLMLTEVIGGQSVDNRDVMLMSLLADDAKRCLEQAACAMAGMVKSRVEEDQAGPMVGVTALGVTTDGVEHLIKILDQKGYDPVVFHARSEILEELITEGRIKGVVDFTSFETHLRGEERLLSAGEKSMPQVIVPGGLDMLIFPGTADMLSDDHKKRPTHEHGPMIILVRTDRDEVLKAAQAIADRSNAARGPVRIAVPKKGFSSVDKQGHDFFDPETDRVFSDLLKKELKPGAEMTEYDLHVNDPEFAEKAAESFDEIFQQSRAG
jgi:uncharacterized protein (UPF0261 family)